VRDGELQSSPFCFLQTLHGDQSCIVFVSTIVIAQSFAYIWADLGQNAAVIEICRALSIDRKVFRQYQKKGRAHRALA